MSHPFDDDDFDLDALKSAAAKAAPRPDPAARAAHLRLAQENFDRLQVSRQGSTDQARHSSEPARKGLWRGAREMIQHLTGRGALTLTTALVACGFMFTPAGQEIWNDWQRPGAPVVTDADLPPQPQVREEPVVSEAAPEEVEEAATLERVEPAAAPEPVVQNQLATPPAASGGAEARAEVVSESELAQADMVVTMHAPPPTALTRQAAPMPSGAAPVVLHGVPMLAEAADYAVAPYPGESNTVAFANADENGLKQVAVEPVSTFSIDVDTAAWSVVRQSLNWGQLPPPDAVRIEEMINYFPYDYAAPEPGGAPFRPTITVMDTPWNQNTQLVNIAIQGEMPAVEDRPPLNLVFLIDTSGSMEDPAKLPLLRASFRLMVEQLRPEDRVAIVTYAGSAGLALEPTAAADAREIYKALDNLAAGGGTAGQAGLQQAYAVATEMADDAEGAVTRVILATDGDFNVGASSTEEMESFISRQRDSGVFLSVLGFGRGNLNDALMQSLAQNGNGTAAYIDTMSEAQKVLSDQLTGALFPIASDVKIQVEWNPAVVAEYRLIGYETRALNREDFNNDRVDAGDLGAGHAVTAIYEITPVGSPAVMIEPLRYGEAAAPAIDTDEIGFLRLRWKEPGASASELMETPITAGGEATDDARWAAAIAGFGQLLRGSDWPQGWSWDQAIALASESRGADPYGYRNEALGLMRIAASLSAQ